MAVTIRRGGKRRPSGRRWIPLIGVSVVVATGFILLYLAKTHDFAVSNEQIANKQLLDLNALTGPADFLPFFDFLGTDVARRFFSEKAYEGLRQRGFGNIPNVGTLAKIRVDQTDVGTARDAEERAEVPLGKPMKGPTPGPESALKVRLLTRREFFFLKPRLVVRTPDQFRKKVWFHFAVVCLVFHVVHGIWTLKGLRGDPFILPAVHLLTGIGFLLMVSLRDPLRDTTHFVAFAQGVAIGALFMCLAGLRDFQTKTWRRLAYVPLLASFAISAFLITFGKGPGSSDAKVNLLGTQPVELIKVLLVLFLAGYFAREWEYLRELQPRGSGFAKLLRRIGVPRLQHIVPVIVSMGLILIFFFLQKDMGPALVISFLFLFLYAVARRGLGIACLGVLMIVGGFYAAYEFKYPQTAVDRIDMWLSPWNNVVRGGDQLAYAFWAFASGGVSGTGWGLGSPDSMQEPHTDLILCAAGEELGLAGLCGIFLLFGLLLHRGLKISLQAAGEYTCFLGLAITLLTALQTVLIAGGLLGMVPLSGVTTPFLSYGRSSMIATLLMFGILFSISARPAKKGILEFFRREATWACLVVAFLVIVILVRVTVLQTFHADRVVLRKMLAVQEDLAFRYEYNPRLLEVARLIPRGTIYDRSGVPMALSRWDDMKTHEATYRELGVDVKTACSRLDSRHYPFGNRTFHLLGDTRTETNWGAKNTAYLEKDLRVHLQGFDDHMEEEEVFHPGTRKANWTRRYDYSELLALLRHRHEPRHKAVRAILDRDRDVHATLDVRLQLRVATILVEQIHAARCEAGAAVVIEPRTGDVLASVSYPWVTTPRVRISDAEVKDAEAALDKGLLDRSRFGVYPPGSTFKLVTAIATLRIRPDLATRVFHCVSLPGGGVGNMVPGYHRPIHDDVMDKNPHGYVEMERGTVHSCNAYYAQLGVALGAEPLRSTARDLGISVDNPRTSWTLYDALPYASFGQGEVQASPFRMARVAALIADAGTLPPERWVLDNDTSTAASAPRVLSPEHANRLGQYMREVVLVGTGRRLTSVDPAVAGKTGTAELEGEASHGWFVGFSPFNMEGRQIAFCVLIEHGRYGGNHPAMAAGKIVQAARELGII